VASAAGAALVVFDLRGRRVCCSSSRIPAPLVELASTNHWLERPAARLLSVQGHWKAARLGLAPRSFRL